MCKGRHKRILSNDGGKTEIIFRHHGISHPIKNKKIPIPYNKRQTIRVGLREIELYVVVRRV